MLSQRKIWIGLCLLAAVLSGATRLQASFAQEAAQSADHHAGSHSLATPDHHPTSGDRGTRGNATINPGVRNAIGVRVAPQTGIQENTAPPGLHAPPQLPSAPASGMSRQFPAAGAGGRPGTARLSPYLTGTPQSHGSIGGTALIRPGVAPHAIGGPAKTAAGINGTTFKNKY
jgi:hypothetical protein